jgi:hypothetical protein
VSQRNHVALHFFASAIWRHRAALIAARPATRLYFIVPTGRVCIRERASSGWYGAQTS